MNCKFIKRLIENLLEKCDGDIDRNRMVYNATLWFLAYEEKLFQRNRLFI